MMIEMNSTANWADLQEENRYLLVRVSRCDTIAMPVPLNNDRTISRGRGVPSFVVRVKSRIAAWNGKGIWVNSIEYQRRSFSWLQEKLRVISQWLAFHLEDSKHKSNIAVLDGVRAIAALLVVAFHISLIT